MNAPEYLKKLEFLEKRHAKEKVDLARECAFSKNNIFLGDIIRDFFGYIQVSEIDVYVNEITKIPCCVYFGQELNKDSKRVIYQFNILEIKG
jgi:hypothetical protein